MRLRACVDEYLIGEGLSSKTITAYRYGLEKLLAVAGDIEVSEDGLASATRRCLKGLEDAGLSKHTQHQVRRSIGTFFEWLIREEKLGYNPIRRVRRVKLPKRKLPRLSDGDKRKLLKAALESRNPRRDYTIFCVLFDTGLRRGEMVRLNVSDVDLGRRVILVRNGKGGKDREVPIGTVTRGAIIKYLNGREKGPLSLTGGGRRFTSEGFYQVIRRVGKRAGVKAYPHLGRHTFAKDYLEESDARALQEIMGHASLSTIEPYTGDSIEDLVRKHEKASPVDRLLGGGLDRLL